MNYASTLAQLFNTKEEYAQNIIALLDDGNTIPFIARYRKEATGALNDEVLRNLDERLTYLRGLEEKKEQVLRSIEEQGKLTDELKAQIEAAATMVVLEDLYRPYRPKRRTRATIAKEKGLEPLATVIMLQKMKTPLLEEAAKYINEENPDFLFLYLGETDEYKEELEYIKQERAKLDMRELGAYKEIKDQLAFTEPGRIRFIENLKKSISQKRII